MLPDSTEWPVLQLWIAVVKISCLQVICSLRLFYDLTLHVMLYFVILYLKREKYLTNYFAAQILIIVSFWKQLAVFFYSHHVWLKEAVKKIMSSIALLNLDFTRVTEIWGPFTEPWLNCYWGHEALVSPSWSSTLVWAFKNWTQKDIYRICPEFQWEPMFCLIWFVVVCLTLSQNNSWHFSIRCSIISSEML